MRRRWILCWTSWVGFAACAGGAAAAEADSTNGVFGRGSYVGSDHWLSTLTQSALAEAAKRRLEGGAKGGGAPDGAAQEDAEKGYFRIPACRTDGHAAPAGEIWVRPAPDGCWKRPVLARPIACPAPEDVVGSPPSGGSRPPAGTGPGYRPPESDRGTAPPASDGGWRPPVSDGGYRPPSSDGGWRPPQSDGGYRPPASDGGWRPPTSDGSYRPPVSDGGWRPPSSDGGYRPPTSDGGWRPPQSDGSYRPPVSDGGWRPPTSDGSHRPPVSDGGWRPPVSDGDFKSPRSDEGFKSPRSDGGYTPPGNGEVQGPPWPLPPHCPDHAGPPSDGGRVNPGPGPEHEDEREDEEEEWEEEDEHDVEPDDGSGKKGSQEPSDPPPLPEGNSEFKRPQSDGDYKSPGSASAAPPVRTSRNPGRGASKKTAARESLEEALARADRCVLARDIAGAQEGYRAALGHAGKKGGKLEGEIRLALGISLLGTQRLCEAVDQLKLAAKRSPGSATRVFYGLALLFKGDFDEAQKQLADCKGSKTEGLSDLLLGIAADLRGKSSTATKAYVRYLKRADSSEVRARVEELGGSSKRKKGPSGAKAKGPGSPGRVAGEAPRGGGDQVGEHVGDRGGERGGGERGGDARVAGAWRVFSSRIFYDVGGAGAVGDKVFRQLELSADGRWKLGPSGGEWTISEATPGDWKRWKVDPYGPRRKITFHGWDGGGASGPVEESSGRIDFLWAIYRAGPPSAAAPGDVHMKFGKS